MVGDCPGGNCPCDYSPGGVVTVVQESRHGGGGGGVGVVIQEH